MSTSKSSLPETTFTSSSLYSTSYALKTEICLAMKCVTSHHSQKSMDELPYVLVIIFPDSKIVESVTLDHATLTYVSYCAKKDYCTFNLSLKFWPG